MLLFLHSHSVLRLPLRTRFIFLLVYLFLLPCTSSPMVCKFIIPVAKLIPGPRPTVYSLYIYCHPCFLPCVLYCRKVSKAYLRSVLSDPSTPRLTSISKGRRGDELGSSESGIRFMEQKKGQITTRVMKLLQGMPQIPRKAS